MLLAEVGYAFTRAMEEVAPVPELVTNSHLLVLSHIELEGPRRPRDLAGAVGMSTGGLSKLLDRMEELGVVERRRGLVDGDRRAVVVSNTELGSEMIRRVT
jgi:DNA-binding MarR family transcriptional regulator